MAEEIKKEKTEEELKRKHDRDIHARYYEKLKDIKVRIPLEYFDKVKACADAKNISVNALIISLLEKEIDEKILTIREKNKLENDNK